MAIGAEYFHGRSLKMRGHTVGQKRQSKVEEIQNRPERNKEELGCHREETAITTFLISGLSGEDI